ncbi:GtrA family protein [Syntrophomonas palmitatica]|uniref:GtrA family protein n=1 Tax=Syntrophomonas palmitatica TaxID=402877 RepID=UPI0006D20A65|nr:GtrA family protein [Syntrophomonas palmitatica]
MSHKKQSRQFLRFCTVGAGNTLVDLSLFFLLTLGPVPYLLAQVLAYSAGVVNSFIFNRYWTFRVKGRSSLAEITRFIIVNGISLAFTSGLLVILCEAGHTALWLAKTTATGAGIILNFIGSRWVFADKGIIQRHPADCNF